MARHHLSDRTDDIVEAVRAVGGVQAQLPSAAEWAIGARVDGITVDDVRAELWERKRLVKAYTLRGTLHLVPADEAALWAAATRPLDDDDELVEAVGRALRGRCLTRAELAEAVGDERLLSQWGDFVSPAATRGVLCFGPPRGSQVTFVHREDWGVPWKRHGRAAAQREAAKRYLYAYGPAAAKDFARWMHIDPAEAKAAFEGLDAYDAGGAPPEGPTTVRLLPQYDAYMLGAFPREKVVPASAKARTSSYGKGKWEGPAALPVVLVDGVVAGMWARKVAKRSVRVTVEPFVDIDEALLRAEAERLGTFLGVEPTLTVGRLG